MPFSQASTGPTTSPTPWLNVRTLSSMRSAGLQDAGGANGQWKNTRRLGSGFALELLRALSGPLPSPDRARRCATAPRGPASAASAPASTRPAGVSARRQRVHRQVGTRQFARPAPTAATTRPGARNQASTAACGACGGWVATISVSSGGERHLVQVAPALPSTRAGDLAAVLRVEERASRAARCATRPRTCAACRTD